MNNVETKILKDNPCLTRIPSNQFPREIQIFLIKRLNPDYRIFEPPHRGIWVEVKGHLMDREWYSALRAMPEWMRRRYKVICINRKKAERMKMVRNLQELGIDCIYNNEEKIPKEWMEYAFDLFTNGSPDAQERQESSWDFNDTSKAKCIVKDWSTTLEESISHVYGSNPASNL